MTITIEELRRKYPEPIRTPVMGAEGTYCVGGALLLELGFSAVRGEAPVASQSAIAGRSSARTDTLDQVADEDQEHAGMFPDPAVLAEVLCRVNPVLPRVAALSFAKTIARKNDTGNFETAWGLLGDALAWTEEWTDADDAAPREFAGQSG